MGLLAAAVSLGFAIIYINKLRSTGAEVFGDRIWWNDLRPIHAALYALFAVSALARHPSSWLVLVADVVLGMAAWTSKHALGFFSEG